MLVDAHQKVGHGQHRIMTQPARYRSGMGSFAPAGDPAVTDVPADSGDEPDRFLSGDQDGTLFDVQFEPAGEARRVENRLAGFQQIDVGAALPHAVLQRLAAAAVR